jgi:hypothetical protein
MGPDAFVEDVEVLDAPGIRDSVEDLVMRRHERLVALAVGLGGRGHCESDTQACGDRE